MVKNTIVLLQPKIGDMDSFRDRPTPPLALLSSAVFLKDTFQIILIDQRIDHNWQNNLLAALKSNPLAVGITTLSGPMVTNALNIAKFIKQHSTVPIVWGGPLVSTIPEQVINSQYVDFLVIGEGETTFAKLIQHIKEKKLNQAIDNVWFKNNNIVYKGNINSNQEFSKLPLAPYDLVDMENYINIKNNLRIIYYSSSRGCPHQCNYCYNTSFHKSHWSPKPANIVLEELHYLKNKYNFQAVYFLDDNFFVDKQRGWAILNKLPALGIKYELQGIDIQTIESFSDEELTLLEKTGLMRMTIGIETGSSRIRKIIGKWGTTADVLRNLKRLANKSYLVLNSFLIGYPFETWTETYETITLALSLQNIGHNFRFPQLFNYTPIKGTPMASWLEKLGYQFPVEFAAWGNIDWDHNSLFYDNPKKQKILEAMSFLSKFIDRKEADYGTSLLVKILYKLYRPIARFRLKNKFFNFIFEKYLYELLK